jgi:hypothetical protein
MSGGRTRMASEVGAFGVTEGAGVGVGVADMGVGVARPPQAASRRETSSKRKHFVRTTFLQRRIQIFYLILKFQSAFRAL